MNFSPFAGHFAGAIPAIHQFAATGALVSSSSAGATSNVSPHLDARYAHPSHHHSSGHSSSSVSGGHPSMNSKYGHAAAVAAASQQQQQQQQQIHYSQYENGNKHLRVGNSSHSLGLNSMANGSSIYHQSGDQNQDLGQLSGHDSKRGLQNVPTPSWQAPSSTVADYLSHLPASTLPLSLHHFLKYSAETIKKESNASHGGGGLPNGDLNHQQPSQHLLQHDSNLNQQQQQIPTTDPNQAQATPATGTTTGKKKKKKKTTKPPKEKKPRPKPGEIRLTTALDGSTLFCCPECQMAYPERGLLEQHLVGHNLERRFICDICNAALKRKDHLTRHKQSHNPERPFVCTICMKAFKRKEQLTLHFVIHSGEKRHICNECGKGFYRKDHLRKHTRSHIARRVKAELSSQQPASGGSGGGAAANGNGQPPTATMTSPGPQSATVNNNGTSSLVVPNVPQHHQMQQQQQSMGR